MKTKPAPNLIPKVTGIYDLKYKAMSANPDSERYYQLALSAARNLGWPKNRGAGTLLEAITYLEMNAGDVSMETGEDGEAMIVDEINYCRDLV